MKIQEALKSFEEIKEKPIKKIKIIGITYSGNPRTFISAEMLASDDWGWTSEVIDPAFQSLLGTVKNKLNGETKPHLVEVKGGKE